ncbi:hypothetical protein N752_23640 [Desulforamulus aquiferis]|nr:hypothetical protein N752_23640 [Desulforamulus aquiferis]
MTQLFLGSILWTGLKGHEAVTGRYGKVGFFSRLKESLTKTRESFVEKIDQVVTGRKGIDEDLYEELEEVLIQADVGVNTAMTLVERVRKGVKARNVQEASRLKDIFQEELEYLMGEKITPINTNPEGPTVIMVVGVNGVAKPPPLVKWPITIRPRVKRCCWLQEIPFGLLPLTSWRFGPVE